MTRRGRRRLTVIGISTLVGATSTAWGPPLLSTMPAFRVQRIEVVGARYVTPEEVLGLADVPPEASVWDDPSSWESRVREHPLVREAAVRRSGLRELEIRVEEAEPVALVATPELVPLDRDGRLLPLRAAEHALDLPILADVAGLKDGRLASGAARELLALLVRLGEHDPTLVDQISELRVGPGPAIELRLLEQSAAERVLLPFDGAITALRRVETALADVAGRAAVATADARFSAQVVLLVKKEGA
ncbi:MAG: cell division protein FtsQ/DivIB [Gemmatimonadota bacterium]